MVALVGVAGEALFPSVYLGAALAFTAAAVAWAASRPAVDAEEWLALIAVLWCALAALAASGNAFSSKATLGMWSASGLVWVLVRRAGGRGRRMTRAVLVGAAAILVAGVLCEAVGLQEPRAGGLMSNPNITVALVAPVVPMVFVLASRSWVAVVCAAGLAAPLMVTGSRAAALALVVLVGVLIPSGRWKRRLVLACVLVLTAGVVWRLAANPETLAWHRFQIWRAVLSMIQDSPFWGIGAGDLGEAAGPYRIEHSGEVGRWGHVIGTAESMPLGFAVRIGVPGLLLVGAWAIAACRRLRYCSRNEVACLATIAVIGAFHDFLNEPAVLWWWAAVLGLCFQRVQPCDMALGGDVKARAQAGRWPVVLATAGLFAWLLIQPALAMVRMWPLGSEPTVDAAAIVRIEPWYPDPMRFRLQSLLSRPAWSWEEASEALDWSHRLVEVCPGAAWAWELRALVHTRTATNLGGWPATVGAARDAFGNAVRLQPHLPWYLYRWAVFERIAGNIPEANRLVVAAVREEPDFARGWMLVARLALDQGRSREAQEAFEQVERLIGVNPRLVTTTYQKALVEVPPRQLTSLQRELR